MGSFDGKQFSLEIIVPFGDPTTLRILTKSGWQGTGLAFPRSLFPEIRKRRPDDFEKSGVYLLTGVSADNKPQIYVGKGIIQARMRGHLSDPEKEWWSDTVAFTDDLDRLDDGHWLYIEAKLIARAKEARGYSCTNSQVGKKSLAEAKRIVADHFLEEILLCLPLLGVDSLDDAELTSEGELVLKSKGLTAQGVWLASNSFVVSKGSRAVGDVGVQASCPSYVRQLRIELVAKGVLKSEGPNYRFTSDYTFNSPSQAACTVVGGSVNGLVSWKDSEGRSLGDRIADT